MPASIGVNLRVTGHCRQGGRKYMEDFFSVAYQQTDDEKDLEYAFFGIYDGHGGGEAATFAKEHLMESIVRQKNFWSDKDEDVLRAIKDGYINTHYAMWKEREKWPKTASGLPSTAGTTASVAFIRRGKIYIGHVGDSGIILGYQKPDSDDWLACPLTREHKPENETEMSRIAQCGGKVITKSGIPRVVWNRPRIGHKGPVRRSTPIDEIPFLAIARSLGDLWSYNSALDEFIVSPDPDTSVVKIDTNTFRCLIFGTDGLWNMMSPSAAVSIVQAAERHNVESYLNEDSKQRVWINPSKSLVEHALKRWSTTRMRADNTSVVTLMLDPPGPPRAQVVRSQKYKTMGRQSSEAVAESQTEKYPENGLQIVTRYSEEGKDEDTAKGKTEKEEPTPTTSKYTEEYLNKIHRDLASSYDCKPPEEEKGSVRTATDVCQPGTSKMHENIQINEVSSSSALTEERNDAAAVAPELPVKPKVCDRQMRPREGKTTRQKPACSEERRKTVTSTTKDEAQGCGRKRDYLNESDEENDSANFRDFQVKRLRTRLSEAGASGDNRAQAKPDRKLRERNVNADVTVIRRRLRSENRVPEPRKTRHSTGNMKKRTTRAWPATRSAMQTRNRSKRNSK